MSEDGWRGLNRAACVCVCVRDKLLLVHMRVFLWKSHSGSTNTIGGSAPARKQGSFNGLHRTHVFTSTHTHTYPRLSSFVGTFIDIIR